MAEHLLLTPRLRLRAWTEADAADLFALASDPEVGPRAGWPPHTSLDESLGVIRTVFNNSTTWAIVLRSTDTPIGAIGYGPSCDCHLPARCAGSRRNDCRAVGRGEGIDLYGFASRHPRGARVPARQRERLYRRL